VLALRLIVEWDGAVVEDRLFVHHAIVWVGTGRYATVVAPGPEERYVTFARRGDAWELRLPGGVARSFEVPGEPSHDGATALRRTLAVAGVEAARCGTLQLENATVTFELVPLKGRRRDHALWGWAAAALVLALAGGGTYELATNAEWRKNDQEAWSRLVRKQQRDRGHIRVRLGPEGQGSARPQAGQGVALHGEAHGPRLPPPPSNPTPPSPSPSSTPGTHASAPEPRLTRDQRLERAQAALLNADLRRAVDDLARVEKEGPLDYEQLNWLGLAHYMQGSYADAAAAFERARALDPERADAINNLANVAKRRHDEAGERALLDQALALSGEDCHATNGLALILAKQGRRDEALDMLQRSDEACGGGYAYTAIQRAAILALDHDGDGALRELERGLGQLDTLVPIKEFEAWNDLTLDPAFASLRGDQRFTALLARYLPRASKKG
jgi:tetratricopeptide (TPR) repeat protein